MSSSAEQRRSAFEEEEAAPRPAARSAVRALPVYVPGRKAESTATAALASNESHFDPLPSVLGVVSDAAESLNRYPDAVAAALRERLAAHLTVDSDQIAVGPGSVGVLQQIIAAFCDAGDEVVFAWRSFEAYPILVSLAGAVPVPVALTADERHDLDGIAAAITERTRVVLLCTPNNPTGTTIRHDELEALLTRVPAHVVVVIDEAYIEFDDDPRSVDSLRLLAAHDNVVVLRTFSKAHGLAGLRVGYSVASVQVADAIRRTALPFGVSTLAQRAAVVSLDAAAELDRRVSHVVQERNRVRGELEAAGVGVPRSGGNFLWIRSDADAQQRLVEEFAAADILVRAYPGDGIRITLADEPSNDRVIDVLRRQAVAPRRR